jgi:hypothetical protein
MLSIGLDYRFAPSWHHRDSRLAVSNGTHELE